MDKIATSNNTAAVMHFLLSKFFFTIVLLLLNFVITTARVYIFLLADIYIKNINDYLEEMAKTIYDYWFVQFDFPN